MLYEIPPITIVPRLAVEMGLNKSIVLYQIVQWLPSGTAKDDRYWILVNYRQWAETRFCWLSKSGVRRLVLELVKDGYLLSEKIGKKNFITVDYEKVNQCLGQES